MSEFGYPGSSHVPFAPGSHPPGPAGRRGSDLAVGGLLILLSVLLVVGSLLDLARFHRDSVDPYAQQPDGTVGGPTRGVWRAWEFTSGGGLFAPDQTLQLLGIGIALVAVVAVIGAVAALTGRAARHPSARAITVVAASMVAGSASTMVTDVVNVWANHSDTFTVAFGPGFWTFVVAAVVAVVTLIVVLVGGMQPLAVIPVDNYGRPLARRAGGLDFVVGFLLLQLAGMTVAAALCPWYDYISVQSAWIGNKNLLAGLLVLGAIAALIAAAMSFAGRGRTAGCASAAALFAAGLVCVLDTMSHDLLGDVRLGALGIGFWLLVAATILALIVTLLAISAASTPPRHRTPDTPIPAPPNWIQPTQFSTPPGWTPPPVVAPPNSVQPQQTSAPQGWSHNAHGPTPAQPGSPQPWPGPQQPPQGQ